MKILDEDFCKIDTAFNGELINNINQIAFRGFNGQELKEYMEHAIKFLMGEKEEGVSNDLEQSSVSNAVMRRNANGEDSPKELEPVAEALEIRTDEKEVCVCESSYAVSLDVNDNLFCTQCGLDKLISS